MVAAKEQLEELKKEKEKESQTEKKNSSYQILGFKQRSKLQKVQGK